MWKRIVFAVVLAGGASAALSMRHRIQHVAPHPVERGTFVAAPPVKIIAEISRLQNWVAWSREKNDPAIRTTYGGPNGGRGASCYWSNADHSVEGRMTITAVGPDSVELERELVSPNPRLTDYDFKVTPEGSGSRLVWSAVGDTDEKIAGDLESGLAALKKVVEAQEDMDAYRVERSTTIAAPDVFVLAEIMDFHEWSKWLPREQLDPEIKRVFAGTDGQPGATYYWSGGDRVGAGRVSMISSSAEQVELEVEVEKPIDSVSDLVFTLTREGEQTRVVWTLTGNKTASGKARTLLGSSPDAIGQEMEEGLANLKLMAEASVPQAPRTRSKTPVASKKRVLQILDDAIVLHASN
jgi:Polyketide cyclase / dehydrase and lipid transport